MDSLSFGGRLDGPQEIRLYYAIKRCQRPITATLLLSYLQWRNSDPLLGLRNGHSSSSAWRTILICGHTSAILSVFRPAERHAKEIVRDNILCRDKIRKRRETMQRICHVHIWRKQRCAIEILKVDGSKINTI